MVNIDQQMVRPISPVAGYIGGKRTLAKVLVPKIAAIPHELYAEPFMGLGGVFFRRDRKPKVEVVNDLSADVSTLFRVLQRHHRALLDMLKWQIASRADYERLLKVDPTTLTDLERAARFLFLQKMSFGGKVTGRSFGIDTRGPAKFDLGKMTPVLEAAHERLAGVYIERLPWRDFIDRWDRPFTLFVVDPPYWGSEDYYGRELFSRDQFDELSERLRRIAGRFLLTINDRPEVRRLFDWAKIEPVRLTYSTGGKPTEGRELIITQPL